MMHYYCELGYCPYEWEDDWTCDICPHLEVGDLDELSADVDVEDGGGEGIVI